MSRIRLPDCLELVVNRKKFNDLLIFWRDVIVKFLEVVLFLLSCSVTGPSLMSISSLVLELCQFSYIKDSSKIWKSEIPSSEFSLIYGDWGEFEIPSLAQMSLIKLY